MLGNQQQNVIILWLDAQACQQEIAVIHRNAEISVSIQYPFCLFSFILIPLRAGENSKVFGQIYSLRDQGPGIPRDQGYHVEK